MLQHRVNTPLSHKVDYIFRKVTAVIVFTLAQCNAQYNPIPFNLEYGLIFNRHKEGFKINTGKKRRFIYFSMISSLNSLVFILSSKVIYFDEY